MLYVEFIAHQVLLRAICNGNICVEFFGAFDYLRRLYKLVRSYLKERVLVLLSNSGYDGQANGRFSYKSVLGLLLCNVAIIDELIYVVKWSKARANKLKISRAKTYRMFLKA